jgi:hypothetical protein
MPGSTLTGAGVCLGGPEVGDGFTGSVCCW